MNTSVNKTSAKEDPRRGQFNDERGMTLSGFIELLGKHIISMIVTFVIVFAGVCVFTLLQPAKYTATAKLFATYSQNSNSDETSANANNASSYITNQIKSYPSLTTTEAVLAPAAESLGTGITAQELAGKITASVPTNTSFINITAQDGNAQMAAAMANAVAASLSEVVGHSLYSDSAQSPIKLTIVQPAVAPSSPTTPKVKMNIAIGFFVSLFLAILVALLKDLFSTRIHDESELESFIGAPIIGRIPQTEELKDTVPVIMNEPGSPIAEDFRRIGTNLSFFTPVSGTNSKLVIVSSVGVNEGKTTVCANLAAALAETGSSVLLIDADLRHPSIAKKLEIDGSAGLVHVLSRQATVKDVVQKYWKSNFHVMPAGPTPPNAAMLLNSPLMEELIAQALRQYDYVIVDTAPMIVANEAAIFAKQGGGLVLVSRCGYTLKRQLRDIMVELDNLEVSLTGFVVNYAKASKKLAGSSYYYYSNAGQPGPDKRQKKKHLSSSE